MKSSLPKFSLAAISVATSLLLVAMSHANAEDRPDGTNRPSHAAAAAPVHNKLAQAKTSSEKNAPAKSGGSEKLIYEGRPVLEPGQFAGLAGMGYACAKAAPEVMSHLFCYCGCDMTDSHQSLVDCYTSLHGVDCHICQEEAVMALRLHREGVPMAEIQKRVDQEYSHYYPFEAPTENYKKYLSSRLWKQLDSSPAGTAGKPASTDSKTAVKDNGDACTTSGGKGNNMATKPKVKPGFHVGDCCKGDHK